MHAFKEMLCVHLRPRGAKEKTDVRQKPASDLLIGGFLLKPSSLPFQSSQLVFAEPTPEQLSFLELHYSPGLLTIPAASFSRSFPSLSWSEITVALPSLQGHAYGESDFSFLSLSQFRFSLKGAFKKFSKQVTVTHFLGLAPCRSWLIHPSSCSLAGCTVTSCLRPEQRLQRRPVIQMQSCREWLLPSVLSGQAPPPPPPCASGPWVRYKLPLTHLTPSGLLEDCSPGTGRHSPVAGTHSWHSPLGSRQMVAAGVAGVSVAGPGLSWSFG